MALPQRQQCPCCGYYTLDSRGDYQICPVCFWEDDNPHEVFGQAASDRPQGPNRVQLRQARLNFLTFGASDNTALRWVRPPTANEMSRE